MRGGLLPVMPVEQARIQSLPARFQERPCLLPGDEMATAQLTGALVGRWGEERAVKVLKVTACVGLWRIIRH